ncbi:isoleucine--tRNA ligase ISM1 [Sugiyamaella lignohabitans]|uniref:isoleucine--tRNA ligase n=1 Tax=Sugiyamaella lignohabitans TaxID=796027 RepID=A0A167EHT4_9ASCO|nr:isoleucine--tRNA ligase ISM1 [Sugiyamaella lignohabitans]ANB14101.1 isoleucine--tRNA ligase ISM1 [Sugiyamaella lignohabitans]
MLLPRVSSRALAKTPLRSPCLARWNSTTSSTTDIYKKYADTLALPSSTFKSIASAEDIERYIQETGQDLYQWQRENLSKNGEKEVVFHDGPPYANGDLHLGHALNKILKDIINRYHVVKGQKVSYIPGWDCHGLPNELAALEKAKKKHGSKAVQSFTVQKKRELAYEHAMTMSLKQKEAFEGFAVMADWKQEGEKSIYRTLTTDYVLRQLVVFKNMVEKGLISRQERPVYWSVESGTALAESELQYGEHKTQTVVVRYPLVRVGDELSKMLSSAGLSVAELSVAIWTTTPWTLVANRAVAIHPEIEYGIVSTPTHGYIITAVSRYDEIPDHTPTGITFPGSALLGAKYDCPIRGESNFPILPATYVTSTSGTGLVHSAPGHGKEDYLMCKEYKILPYSPIDNYGRYTMDLAAPLKPLLTGLNARKEGQKVVLELLENANLLVSTSTIQHNIPFDWRSKTPVMVRSTPQFFADVGSIKEQALESLNQVKFYPESGKNRLTAFTVSRSEWCISRQRVWGVPIPVLYHKTTGETLMNSETIEHIIKTIESDGDKGLSNWFDNDDTNMTRWLPAQYASDANSYRRGTETMDVWFDSGTR